MRELVPGGYLFLTTGSVDSLAYRLLRANWRQMLPPWHVHFFGKKSIAFLLERCGFNLVNISYKSKNYPLGLLVERRAPNLYQHLKSAHIDRWSIRWNTFDIMFIVARKTQAI